MSNSLKIKVWLFASKKNANNEAPIYYKLSLETSETLISSGILIKPEMWDEKSGRVKPRLKASQKINKELDLNKEKFKEIYLDLREKGVRFSVQDIKMIYSGTDPTNKSLLWVINYHNTQMVSELGKTYTQSTCNGYKYFKQKIEGFLASQKKPVGFPIKDVDFQFITEFENYLKVEKHNQQNTVNKTLTMFKKIINLSLSMEWVTKNPFHSYKCKPVVLHRTYLAKDELATFETTLPPNPFIEITKDCCLLQVYTGAAYLDLKAFTINNIVVGTDGEKWIVYFRRKTKIRAALPILPQAMSIINKYENHPCRTNEGRLIPVMTNQKMNKGIKTLMRLCKIEKNITSHSFRRTFATTVALSNGVSIETISKILGHSTTKITHQYAVVTDLKVSQEMEKLKGTIKEKGAG